MTTESGSQQEPAWPKSNEQQVLQVFEQRGQDLCRPAKRRAGRPATVRWNHLCLAILLCVVRGWNAHLEGWRLIRSERLGRLAPVRVRDHAIYNRLERAATLLPWLFEHVSAWLRTRLAPWEDRRLAPWATAVYAADARTLAQMSRCLPWLRTLAQGDTRLLAGQISAVCDVRFQPWVRVDCWSNARDHCTAHCLTLVEHVHAGALLLFDRGDLSVAFFDALTARGIWWISRSGHQMSQQVSPICDQADGVLDAMVSLGTASSNQAHYPVRLIHVWLHGRHSRSLTTVRDPQVLRLSDVVRFSARRWEIDLAFRALKDPLNLHHLWSAKWAVMHVQLWCCLILAQISHAIQGEIAGQAGVEVFEVSLDLLIRLAPGWLSRGLTPLEHAVRFGRELGLIRPSTRHRIEVPWVDPCWVIPPPPEAVQPREMVHSRSQTKGTRPKRVGLVRLKAGTLSVLE